VAGRRWTIVAPPSAVGGAGADAASVARALTKATPGSGVRTRTSTVGPIPHSPFAGVVCASTVSA